MTEYEKQAHCQQMQEAEICAEINRVLDHLVHSVNERLLPRGFEHIPPIIFAEDITRRAAMRIECMKQRQKLADYLIGIRRGTA